MTTPQTDRLVGATIDGRYRVIRRLASGGMATVYVAIDERLDREVAVKVMHPHLATTPGGMDFVARFRREAKAAARLAHPNLVAVHDQGIDGDVSYLVMELVTGTNLRARLVAEPPLTVRHAFSIIDDVLAAVATVHEAGLVHRDIKPENILLGTDGRVKVADFGLARAVTEVTAASTGTIFGTVAYLAPELIDRGLTDARTDIYAIGATFFETLTGKPLFEGETAIQVALQHLSAPSPLVRDWLPWLPTDVEQLVASMIARDADDRFTDATAAKSSLRSVRAQLSEQVLDMPVRAPEAAVTAGAPDLSDTAEQAPIMDEDEGPASRLTAAVPLGTDTGVTRFFDEFSDANAPSSAPESAGSHTVALDLQRTVPHQLVSQPGAADDIGGGSGAVAPARGNKRRRGKIVARVVITLAILALLVGGGLFVYNSAGPGAYATLPTSGMTGPAESVEQTLASAGFVSDRSSQYSDTVAAGIVISTDPAPGTRVRKGSTVALVVSLGIEHFDVPSDIVGSRRKAAIAAIKEQGFSEPTIETEYYDDVDKGEVTQISVPEGSSQPHDTVIVLTVSDGKAPVQIPNVVGHPQKDARADIEALRLVWAKAKSEFSDTVPKGNVIRQDPAAGAQGHVLDTVTVVVSKGPELVVVPDVRGMTEYDAVTTLKNAGLEVDVNQYLGAYFDRVRFQSEDPNTEVPKGTTITITIW